MAQPIITDKIAGNNKSDYHLITTTHPYLIELGLGSFTIPSLSAWWNEKSHEGVYLHRKCINNQIPSTLGDPTNSIGDLLGISTDTEFFWNGWKPNKELENAGVYKKYDLSTYDGNTGSPSGSNPWTFSSAVGEVTIDNTLISTVGDPTKYIVGGTLDGSLNFKNNVYDYDATDGLENLSPIYDVVNLNRYMSAFSDFNPRSTWDKDEPNSNIAGQNTKQLFASHEFLTDIKTSKLGPYIEWSGEVTFYINEGHLCDQGITEWIPFKLHLFDSASSDVSANTVTLKSLKYVAPRRDVTGKLFGTKTDGGHTEYNPDDVASQGVGDIDLSMNPITKKWEGGSPTLFAKMVTKIGKPSVPTVEYLESSNTTDALDNDEYEGVKFIPTTGIAMPIRPQNGNPLQWQPNYLEPDDVRCSTGSVEKETLTVYNFSTQRQFNRDEEVMLTRIDSVWHVSAMGENLLEDDDTVTGEVGKWGEFTYMMTNSRFFFKDKNRKDFTPREAELFFHKLYYEGDDINSNVDYGISGGWDKISTFNTNDIKEVYLDNGYAQTTSFDYLDQKLCGIRGKENHNGDKWEDKCSISTTSATLNAAGHTIPGPESFGSRNAAHSAVFFGCVFPEGYVDTSPHLVKGRGYNISAKSVGEIVTTANYIDPQSNNFSEATLSALDGQVDRNNCRLPTRARFDEQLSDSNNHWERYSNEYSASLFYGHTVDKNQSCIQFPADVMTNASPSGANGSPLYPVHRFKNFHTPNGVIYNAKYQEVSKAFLQGIWLGKGYSGEDVVSKYDSAFDFTPKKRDTLMFRPLKMEGYIQFGDDPRSADESRVTDLSKTSAGNHRTGFSVEARRTQKDNERPCTAFFEDREKADGHADLWTTEYGLKWGGDIENKYNNDTTVQRSYNQYHDYLYWNKEYGPMKWTEGFRESGAGFWKNKGGNAYGVITTFNTIKANERIDFSTDNIYGMGAAGWGNIPFSISNGYQHQDKTWGVSQLRDSYRQENIPDLSVRIYQQHPRDQTLFDPRTFAVHHFNPDVRYANDLYMKDDGTTEAFYRTPQLSTEIDGVSSNGQNIKYQYYYQDSFSVVDLRGMTRNAKHINPNLGEGHENFEQYYPQNVQIDDHIFSDVVMNDTTPFGPVMAEKYWVIDSSRTGKLLPFKYRKQEVGISIPVGTKFVIDGTGSPNDPAQHLDTPNFDNMPASTILGKMCVKSKGTGYVAGDTVGLDDIVFKVETVEENSGDTQGAIKELKCISRGTGFSESQTAAHDDKFNSDTNGPITLGTLSTEAGEGFDAYFVSISVYYVDMIDPKPYLMKRDGEEIVRVASDVSQSTGPNTGHDAAAEAGAFVNETYGISYTLDPTLYSDNKEYDVFFHFHNDITMTWMASQEHFHGSSPTNYIGNNQTPAHEQHITVKINPR
jgi:hypothetical protein